MQRKQHQCRSCKQPIKGHRYPWGKNCIAPTMDVSQQSLTLPVCTSMAACRTTSTVSTCNVIYTTANANGFNVGISTTASVRLSSSNATTLSASASQICDQDQVIRRQQERIRMMELQLQEQHLQQQHQQQQHQHRQHQQPQQDTITEVLQQLQRQQSQIDKLIQHQLHGTDVTTGSSTQHMTPVTETSNNVRQDVTDILSTADAVGRHGQLHSGDGIHHIPTVATSHHQDSGHTLPSLTDIRQGNLMLGFAPNHGPTASATTSTGNRQSYIPSPRGKPNCNLLWPNEFIHRAGTAEVPFDRLSLPEVVCGTMRIISSADVTQEEKDARITHMTDLMIMAEQYKWDSVRSLYQEALSLIQNGRSTWRTSIKELKEEMLRPWDQLPPPRSRPTNGRNIHTLAGENGSEAPICNQWNFNKTGCPRKECGLRHVCKECSKYGFSEDKHRAKECPRRVKPTPSSST